MEYSFSIPSCGVAGSRSEALVLYMLNIIELLYLDRNWPSLKNTLMQEINEDKTLW